MMSGNLRCFTSPGAWRGMGLLALAFVLAGPAAGLAQEADPILCLNTAGHTSGVRALAFSPNSQLLYSAGMDKVVHVWRLSDLAGRSPFSETKGALVQPWRKDPVIRWEIARSLRGSIYSLAVDPLSKSLAIGGYGARSMNGEIVRVDPGDHAFQASCCGHLQSLWALAFSSDGKWLASTDLAGEARLWRQGAEESKVLTRPDREVYDRALLEFLEKRSFRPLAVVGSKWVALPHYVKAADDVAAEIELYDIDLARRERTLPQLHHGAIRALAASADGSRLASADERGNLLVWELGGAEIVGHRLPSSKPVISLAFSRDGAVLIAGTEAAAGAGDAEVQVWNVPQGALRQKHAVEEAVYACAVSLDGRRIAHVAGGGNDILVRWLDEREKPLLLPGGQQIAKAAFARTGAPYAFLAQAAAPASAPAKRFDPATLESPAPVSESPQSRPALGQWRGELDSSQNAVALYHGSEPKSLLSLDRRRQGVVKTFCWIPNAQGQAEAIAVGTDLQCGVYVYELTGPADRPPLVWYRGHQDAVTSLDASRDGRYLLSASRDGTVRYWRLAGGRSASPGLRRWGAELDVEAGRLVVKSIDDLGPLAGKGVRSGDVIQKIVWAEAPKVIRTADAPQEILARLADLPFDTQVTFYTSSRPQGFMLLGAWNHLLAVYMTRDDQWIAWTPAGYYACSSGGERLIGWQINRGQGKKPEFHEAQDYSKTMHRPAVIQSLLDKGSLREALGQDREPVKTIADLPPPDVRITAPDALRVEQPEATIVVAAESVAKPGQRIQRMWLQVDGIAYDPLSSLASTERASAKMARQWHVPLSPGEHTLVALAETDFGVGRSEVVRATCLAKLPTRPSLFVLCVGISSYPSPWRLRYADKDAAQVAAVLRQQSAPLFTQVEINTVLNEQATRAGILAGLAWLKERLSRSKNPDDAAVVFFSGHGLADRQGQFFLLPVDSVPEADAAPSPAREPLWQNCISAEELKRFCQEALPCHLAVFLDACRSGAAELPRRSDALARGRLGLELARSDCGVVLIASSRGDQDSREDEALQAGIFTEALVGGLRGKGCLGDQTLVFVPNLYIYLRHSMALLTKGLQEPELNYDNPLICFPLSTRDPLSLRETQGASAVGLIGLYRLFRR